MEIDNIRSATEWGQAERPEDVLLLIGDFFFYWTLRVEDRHQAIRFLKMLLAKLDELPEEIPPSRRRMRARARGKTIAALLLMGVGDSRASIAEFSEAIALDRQVGDRFYLAFALSVQASQAIIVGDPANRACRCGRGQALLRKEGENRWLLIALPTLAGIEQHLGNQARADALRRECRLYLRQSNHPMFIPTFLGLGFDAKFRGQIEEGASLLQQGLKIAKRIKTNFFAVGLESELAHLDRESGDLQVAKEAYRKLIETWKDLGHYAAVAHLLECFAYIALREDDPGRATRLFGAAEGDTKKHSHYNDRGRMPGI